jgi:hypothetical protein
MCVNGERFPLAGKSDHFERLLKISRRQRLRPALDLAFSTRWLLWLLGFLELFGRVMWFGLCSSGKAERIYFEQAAMAAWDTCDPWNGF